MFRAITTVWATPSYYAFLAKSTGKELNNSKKETPLANSVLWQRNAGTLRTSMNAPTF